MVRLTGMRLLLAIVTFSMVGLGCSETLPFHGDVTFTADERASIERGAAFIAARLGEEPVEIVWDAPHAEGVCEDMTIQRGAGTGGQAFPDHQWCIFVGTETYWGTTIESLAAHELGHWRGMGHVDHGLMQPMNPTLIWSDEDQAECVRAGRC